MHKLESLERLPCRPCMVTACMMFMMKWLAKLSAYSTISISRVILCVHLSRLTHFHFPGFAGMAAEDGREGQRVLGHGRQNIRGEGKEKSHMAHTMLGCRIIKVMKSGNWEARGMGVRAKPSRHFPPSENWGIPLSQFPLSALPDRGLTHAHGRGERFGKAP